MNGRTPVCIENPTLLSFCCIQVEVEDDIDYVAQAVADMSVATTGPPSSVSSQPPSPPPQRKSAAATATTSAHVDDVSQVN